VEGVQLIDDGNECNESSCRVELNLLGVKSSGVYRCEVSGDAPHFQLTARDANMTVEGEFTWAKGLESGQGAWVMKCNSNCYS